jgi:hypothetical protein
MVAAPRHAFGSFHSFTEHDTCRVMLTVLKNNKEAMAFYGKMKYEIDASSPSASDEEAGHEILSKIVDKAGVALVEARMQSIRGGFLPSDADTMLAKAPAAGAGKA